MVTYLIVFAIGGMICMLGQVLLNTTKLTPPRILLLVLLIGVALEALGLFKPIEEFAKAGVTVPISGFGSVLTRGAIEGAKTNGVLGAFEGGVSAATAGLTAAIVFGFLIALIFNSRVKR